MSPVLCFNFKLLSSKHAYTMYYVLCIGIFIYIHADLKLLHLVTKPRFHWSRIHRHLIVADCIRIDLMATFR